jgi:hypothetical protein
MRTVRWPLHHGLLAIVVVDEPATVEPAPSVGAVDPPAGSTGNLTPRVEESSSSSSSVVGHPRG